MENFVENPVYYPDLQVMVVAGGHPPVDGHVWSICSNTFVVKTAPNRPLLPVGGAATCVIDGSRMNMRLGADCRVVARFEYDDMRLYSLSPADLDRYRGDVYKPFLNGTLRRATMRLTPPAAAKPTIALMDLGRNSLGEADVVDVSEEGLRVLIPGRNDGEVSRLTGLVLRIGLPGENQPIVALGIVRAVQFMVGGLSFGLKLEFESRADANVFSRYYMSVRNAKTNARARSDI